MGTRRDILTALGAATGLPMARLEHYGVCLARAGLVTLGEQGGRPNVATARDAAALLLAIAGTDRPTRAPDVTRELLQMPPLEVAMAKDQAPMMLRAAAHATTFGVAIETLISEAALLDEWARGLLHLSATDAAAEDAFVAFTTRVTVTRGGGANLLSLAPMRSGRTLVLVDATFMPSRPMASHDLSVDVGFSGETLLALRRSIGPVELPAPLQIRSLLIASRDPQLSCETERLDRPH